MLTPRTLAIGMARLLIGRSETCAESSRRGQAGQGRPRHRIDVGSPRGRQCGTRRSAIMANHRFTRREFIKLGAVSGGVALVGAASTGPALANRHPHPRPTSLPYLDRNMYRKDTDVLAHFEPGEERGAKMQMMAIGQRRFLFQQGDVIEVTEPLRPDRKST